MVVFVHSLGSLWQEKILPEGGTRIWNTTGIQGSRVRSCAMVFGQVLFSAKARGKLSGSRSVAGTAWIASQPGAAETGPRLKLLCRAARASVANLYLVTVTEDLVGELQMESWDPGNATLLSFSQWKSRQEVMLLMRPFAWLRGSNGSAVLIVNAGNCEWNVRRW